MKLFPALPIVLFSVLLPAVAAPAFGQAPPSAPARLAPPPAAPAPAQPAPSTVPFQYVNDKIVVQATIDGSGPYSLGIDSGAETVMITQKTADSAKLAVKTGTVEISGTTGNWVPVVQADIGQIQVGSAVVKRPFCTVSPEPIPVDGYIGAPLFNAYVVEIDSGNRLLTCIPPASFKPDPADIALPIVFGKHRVPVVRGEIGGIPASFEIDTGSGFPAELAPAFVKANDLTHKFDKIGTAASLSVGGPIQSDVYALPSVSLGTAPAAQVVLPNIPALFLNPAGAPVIGDWDGRVGAPALQRLVLTFDYAHSLLYVRVAQPPDSQAPPITPAQPAPPQPGASTPTNPAP